MCNTLYACSATIRVILLQYFLTSKYPMRDHQAVVTETALSGLFGLEQALRSYPQSATSTIWSELIHRIKFCTHCANYLDDRVNASCTAIGSQSGLRTSSTWGWCLCAWPCPLYRKHAHIVTTRIICFIAQLHCICILGKGAQVHKAIKDLHNSDPLTFPLRYPSIKLL